MPGYIGSVGREESQILCAECALDVKFAADYRKYLREIGLACFDGVELTGLTKIARLDVVAVTKEKRSITAGTEKWYVIEEANIDDIVIWQDTNGLVYQTDGTGRCRKIAESLAAYIVASSSAC